MLNEKRVKHMVKLASYDEQNGEEEVKISSYFKKDYVSYNVVMSLLWATLGYGLVIFLLFLIYIKETVERLAVFDIVMLIVGVVAGYILVLIFYGVIATRHYKRKHQVAKSNVKRYLRNLDILEKMYDREEE